MNFNDTSSILNTIEQEMHVIEGLLYKNAFSGHTLLAEQAHTFKNLPLAKLLLIAASLGRYQPGTLYPVAVGLELLHMAVDTHYPFDGAGDSTSRNLNLITADFYYARAIQLAAGLGRGEVVEYMVKAIADISSNAFSDVPAYYSKDDKSLSLFTTTARLGTLLGECPESMKHAIEDFASAYGFILKNTDAEDSYSSDAIDDVRNTALDAVKILPPAQRTLLEQLVEV